MKREENSRFLMNQSTKNPSLTPTDFKRRMRFLKEVEETDENQGHPQTPFTSISAPSKNKILGERNENDSSNTHLETTLKEKRMISSQETHPLFSKIPSFSDSSPPVPYDPVNNYTSPRPAFLRYNPDRRKEILLRMKDEEIQVVHSIEEDSMSVSSSEEIQEDEEDGSDVEVGDFEEKEVEEKRSWCSSKVLKLLPFAVFLFSHYYLFPMSSSSSPLQEKLPTKGNSLNWNLLKTHMVLSNQCLDIGEGMCDLFFQGDFSMNDLFGSDEVNGALSLDELEESVEDLMYEDCIQNVEKSVFEEEIEEPMSSQESLEQEWNYQREGSLKEENLRNETIEIGEESVIAEEREEPMISYESIEHEWSIQREESAKEEILMNETIENLSDSEDFRTYKEAPIETTSTMEFESGDIYENSFGWKLVLDLASKNFQLLFLSLSLLTAMVGFLIALFQYFAKSHKKPSRISTEDSNLNPLALNHSSKEHEESFVAPRSQSADEKRIYPSVSVMEELRVEDKDSNVNNFHLPSSSSVSNEFKGFYATTPPTVEFLGEFSFVDALASKAASAQTMKSTRHDEPKISFFEEPQPERKRMVKIKPSPSPDKVHPHHAEEFTSHEKIEKKEVTAEKSEGKNAAITPLRRSNRLRNRVTSPMTA